MCKSFLHTKYISKYNISIPHGKGMNVITKRSIKVND